jgi:hypothetical protein
MTLTSNRCCLREKQLNTMASATSSLQRDFEVVRLAYLGLSRFILAYLLSQNTVHSNSRALFILSVEHPLPSLLLQRVFFFICCLPGNTSVNYKIIMLPVACNPALTRVKNVRDRRTTSFLSDNWLPSGPARANLLHI